MKEKKGEWQILSVLEEGDSIAWKEKAIGMMFHDQVERR